MSLKAHFKDLVRIGVLLTLAVLGTLHFGKALCTSLFEGVTYFPFRILRLYKISITDHFQLYVLSLVLHSIMMLICAWCFVYTVVVCLKKRHFDVLDGKAKEVL